MFKNAHRYWTNHFELQYPLPTALVTENILIDSLIIGWEELYFGIDIRDPNPTFRHIF